MAEKMDNPELVLDKLNKTLDELIRFKSALMATMETANDRMDRIEVKIQEVKPTQVQIDKVEKEIEKLSNEKGIIERKASEFEKKIEEISKFTKELDKKWSDDNKFMEGTYMEMKDHMKETDEKFRQNAKDLRDIEKEINKATVFKTALQNFIKAVME